jgi:hypothetical protein
MPIAKKPWEARGTDVPRFVPHSCNTPRAGK